MTTLLSLLKANNPQNEDLYPDYSALSGANDQPILPSLGEHYAKRISDVRLHSGGGSPEDSEEAVQSVSIFPRTPLDLLGQVITPILDATVGNSMRKRMVEGGMDAETANKKAYTGVELFEMALGAGQALSGATRLGAKALNGSQPNVFVGVWDLPQDSKAAAKYPELVENVRKKIEAGFTEAKATNTVFQKDKMDWFANANDPVAVNLRKQLEVIPVEGVGTFRYTPAEDGLNQFKFYLEDSPEHLTAWWRSAVKKQYADVTNEKKLSDVYKHPELYQMYPALRDVRVVISPLKEGLHGRWTPSERFFRHGPDFGGPLGTLELNSKNTVEGMYSTLIHEIQHAVQDLIGGAKGGMPEYVTTYAPIPYDEIANIDIADRSLDMLVDSWNTLKSRLNYLSLHGEHEARLVQHAARIRMRDKNMSSNELLTTAEAYDIQGRRKLYHTQLQFLAKEFANRGRPVDLDSIDQLYLDHRNFQEPLTTEGVFGLQAIIKESMGR